MVFHPLVSISVIGIDSNLTWIFVDTMSKRYLEDGSQLSPYLHLYYCVYPTSTVPHELHQAVKSDSKAISL